MLIIGNGMVVTRNPQNPFLKQGAVVIDGTIITKVTSDQEIRKKHPDATYIDAKGCVIMPAFINTHEHGYSALARGLSVKGYHPQGFLDILDGMWWNIDRHLTLEGIRLSAMATYIEAVKNGVTTVFDHHASYGAITDSLFTIEEAAKKVGIRVCLCYEVSDRDGKEKAKEAVLENERFIEHTLRLKDDMVAAMMGMHASFTISDETMELCAMHKPGKAGYHIHVAEGKEDLSHCLDVYGKRVVERLMDWNILGSNTLAAHCTYINHREIECLKETDTMVVHNPESNMGNACGYPAAMDIVHQGVLTGLGTDGYTHDMIESYKVANLLHKYQLQDANAAWSEVPEMLFNGNAKIANRYFDKPLGVLEEGAAGDVIITDYYPPTPMHAENINSHILFGMTGRCVVTTIANGKILMKDRILLNVDEEKIIKECRKESEKLENSINNR
ncbi:MAG: putative aminohydrolase SsnA [Lachnospiraceae bacterium]